MNRAWLRRLSWLFELAVAGSLGSLLVHTALDSAVNHNEHMYVAAARLWAERRMYLDYAYLQAPLLPMLNAALFALTGGEQLLLASRLHVAVWGALALGTLYWLGRSLPNGDRTVGLAAALAVGSHGLFLSNAAESSNYMLPLAASLMSLFTLLRATTPAWMVASGLLSGLAVACKSFYLFLGSGMFAMVWSVRGLAALVPWAIGAVAGTLSASFYWIRDHETFYFGNLGYHLANVEYWRGRGSQLLTLPQKLGFFGDLALTEPSLIAFAALAFVSSIVLIRTRASLDAAVRMCLCSWGLSFVALGIALLPSPPFPQYFAIPLVFTIVTAAVSCAGLGRPWKAGFVALCLAGLAFSPATRQLWNSAPRQRSVPAQLREDALRLRELVGCSREKRIATLAPVFALEAHCDIYPELATGAFTYRIADQLDPAKQQRLRIVGPKRLQSLLDAQRPAAILIGLNRRYESGLEQYARANGYQRSPVRFMAGGRVWLAPR
jgi:hypothetical protein